MREEPREYQVYRHFKGNLYQVLAIAKHTETYEKMVVYRSLFDASKIYCRPLTMFMSEVDHEKYPEVEAEYRFELMTAPEDKPVNKERSADKEIPARAQKKCEPKERVFLQEQESQEESFSLDPDLERFLDEKTYEKKIDILYDLKKKANEEILSTIAMSLDLELSKEGIEEQYQEIMNCLRIMEKYECNRLR